MEKIAGAPAKLGVSFLALLASTTSISAWAQSPPEPAPGANSEGGAGVDNIIVTAQKRNQKMNDIGITLNAFNGDQISNMGATTAADIALYTPGLTVTEAAASGVPIYTIRGVGFQDYSPNSSSTVGLYFDEVAVPYTTMSRGAIFDIERVEVLKGPQGDLYGRNTTGGQINYISALPKDHFEGQFRASAGSFETLNVDGYVTGPLAPGVNARIAYATTQSNKGWQHSLTRDDSLGKKNVMAVRGLLSFDLGNANLLLRGQYVKDKSDNQAPTAYDGRKAGLAEFNLPYTTLLPFLISGTTPPWYSTGDNQAADWSNSYTDSTGRFVGRPTRNNDLVSGSAKLNWDITPDVTLVSVTAYDHFKAKEVFDSDGLAANDTTITGDTKIGVFSQELRLGGKLGNLDWLVGGYYSNDTVNEDSLLIMSDSFFGQASADFGITVSPFFAAPLGSLDTRYRQHSTSEAVFAHLEYQVLDRVRIILGGRYTIDKRSWTGCTFDSGDGTLANFNNTNYGTSQSPGDCGTADDDPNSPTYVLNLFGMPNINDAFHVFTSEIKTEKFMYKAGVDFKITPQNLLYANVSHGFKSGGFNGAATAATSQLTPYKPEILTAYEAGLKSTLFDRMLQLNLAGFYYDYRDKQEASIAVTIAGNITGLTNVPKSRIYGVDLDATLVPLSGLKINVGAEYLDAKITRWDAISSASFFPNVVLVDASGLTLAQSPKWQINGGAEYSFSIGNGLRLTPGFDANYKAKTSGGVYPQNATDGYTVVNARLALSDEDEHWKLSVWSRNLLNEYYFPAAYQANGPFVRTVGMPRTIGVTGEFNF